ncbi:META domain-containing protein [Pseudooceanicola nanhaiensis]|uniref:META domain-containing protein n=1 Tax=Pseudooceanicola nanhaiensis TaxID=375761 RepID=UPI001CD31F99|nr:META domain-containing protein [Pseudooceanicola nanhaiensis]MCA0922593.1 META domain-containing protein [Pseudooceanicola nanhaiensis]
MKKTLTRSLALAALIAGGPAMAETVELPVVVHLQEGATLPSDTLLQVELLDVSRADAPSTTISAREFRIDSLPAEIRLPYDTDAIDPRMRYVVAAKVAEGDTLLLRTTTSYPALTQDAPERPEIVLEAMTSGISGVEWQAFELGGRMLVVEDAPTIAFTQEGGFAMYGGCNRFVGTAEMSAGKITFPDAIAGTRRMCPEPRMQLEQDMVEAVKASTGYVRYGKNLSLTNAAGVVTMRLTERPE